MCLGRNKVGLFIKIHRARHVLTLISVCLAEVLYLFYRKNGFGFGRMHIPEKRNYVRTVVGRDQFPEEEGDASTHERW